MKIILEGRINEKEKQTTQNGKRKKLTYGTLLTEAYGKLSLGLEAAKYKASIKSSPVVSDSVFQTLLASDFHYPQLKADIVIMDMTILITIKIFLSKYCTFFLLHYDLKGFVEYGP